MDTISNKIDTAQYRNRPAPATDMDASSSKPTWEPNSMGRRIGRRCSGEEERNPRCAYTVASEAYTVVRVKGVSDRVRLHVVLDTSVASLTGIVVANVERGAVVLTDGWGDYTPLRHMVLSPNEIQGNPSGR